MPAGELFGVLFFGSLFLAGITSLISIIEVVFAALADKFGWSRRTTALFIGPLLAVVSIVLFSTTTGLVALDIMDKFTNNIGIVFGAITSVLMVAWVSGRRNEMTQHINAVSSVHVGGLWQACTFVITPAVLSYILIREIIDLIAEPYGGYATAQILAYGWIVLAVIIALAVFAPLASFRTNAIVDGLQTSDYGVPVGGRPAGVPNPLGNPAATPTTTEGGLR